MASHIAAIYDLVDFAPSPFLVLELVEGETLADRIQRGPIAVPEALRIATQIAEALEAAHEKGIIHRDGCVLYEMLTGRRPFEGETVNEVLAGILKSDPDWRRLPAETPEGIRRLLRRCLRKERTLRLTAVPIRFTSDGQTVQAGAPLGLFATNVASTAINVDRQQYMVSPDGQSFVMNSVPEAAGASPITVILNWKPK